MSRIIGSDMDSALSYHTDRIPFCPESILATRGKGLRLDGGIPRIYLLRIAAIEGGGVRNDRIQIMQVHRRIGLLTSQGWLVSRERYTKKQNR
jgi:hypothetical protein